MRKFSSYGPVSKKSEYYVPRAELINIAYMNLVGEDIEEGGHYFTIWAPRQAGKSWIMQEVRYRIAREKKFYISFSIMHHLEKEKNLITALQSIVQEISELNKIELPLPQTTKEFKELFTDKYFDKPLILILDEFDSLESEIIEGTVRLFREMYQTRSNKGETSLKLHGVALIGVRAVLGIENEKGSPFNIQRGMHISNLTEAEVNEMYQWYIKESGQKIDQDVIDKVFYVTNGQPGLVSWFGELLTEQFNETPAKTINIKNWERVYLYALRALPNNTVINIISKAKEEKDTVLELFRTKEKIVFKFENEKMNYLYLNGVISYEEGKDDLYAKFPSQFIQEKLFDHFADMIFTTPGQLLSDPFMDLEDYINETELNIPNIMKLYEEYLQNNKEWLFKEAPRRSDLRLFEAVYHFGLYSYLNSLLLGDGARIYPEFPTGNGKIDLIIKYHKKKYGLELKSYENYSKYKKALSRAAHYGQQLKLKIIYLIFFVEIIPDDKRGELEAVYKCEENSIDVKPVFIATGKN